jgi:hypothetical protein
VFQYNSGGEIKKQAFRQSLTGGIDAVVGAVILVIGILAMMGVLPLGAIACWCFLSVGIANLLIGLLFVGVSLYKGTTGEPFVW